MSKFKTQNKKRTVYIPSKVFKSPDTIHFGEERGKNVPFVAASSSKNVIFVFLRRCMAKRRRCWRARQRKKWQRGAHAWRRFDKYKSNINTNT